MNPPATISPPIQNSTSASSPSSAESIDPYVLRPNEARSLLAGAEWKRFAVLGDSLAEGVGDTTNGYFTLSWADRVAAELGVPAYLNLGTERLTARAVARDQLEQAVAWRPDLVAVIAGGNDVLNADPDLYETERALESIYRRTRESGADVVAFTLMDPSSIFGDGRLARRIGALNSMIRHLAARVGVTLADLAIRPFGDERSIYSADLKHPNMRGHAIVASAVIESLADLLRTKQGQF